MNAIKFIQDNGVDKAREVNEKCPQYYHYYHIAQGAYYTCMDVGRVAVKDLMRLVESVDLVNLKGGVKKLKKEADCLFHNDVEGAALRYEQAIADYEAIGGEHV